MINMKLLAVVTPPSIYHHRPIEITYDQGSEFSDHDFIKPLFETEYEITAKPSTLGNPIYNGVLERIHQVLGNLVLTFNISTLAYVDENDPLLGILAAAAFAIRSAANRQKDYSPGQLIFGR